MNGSFLLGKPRIHPEGAKWVRTISRSSRALTTSEWWWRSMRCSNSVQSQDQGRVSHCFCPLYQRWLWHRARGCLGQRLPPQMAPSEAVAGSLRMLLDTAGPIHRAACTTRGGSCSNSSLKSDLPPLAIILVHEEWGNTRTNEVIIFWTKNPTHTWGFA